MLTGQKKIIILKIDGEFVYIMCEVNPEHKKNVRMKNGVRVLYLNLLKYLYGYMEYAPLWYNLYKKLKYHRFAVNTYGRCTLNSTIDRKQCTVDWYVEDNKVSHFDEELNTKIIYAIAEYFGELAVTILKNINSWEWTYGFWETGND